MCDDTTVKTVSKTNDIALITTELSLDVCQSYLCAVDEEALNDTVTTVD